MGERFLPKNCQGHRRGIPGTGVTLTKRRDVTTEEALKEANSGNHHDERTLGILPEGFSSSLEDTFEGLAAGAAF